MNTRKIIGIVLVIFGLIMVGGSLFTYKGPYQAIAPIAMALIVVAGLLLIFWDQVKSWFGKK